VSGFSEAHEFHSKVLADVPDNKERLLLERIKSEAQAVSEVINQIKDDKGKKTADCITHLRVQLLILCF
jgi:hypothetical protein